MASDVDDAPADGAIEFDFPARSRLSEPVYLTVNEDRVAAAGIRRIDGQRLRLYTDIEEEPARELVEVLDQAYPLWCAYFGVAEETSPPWKMHGYLARDQERFVAAGLWPDSVPPVRNAYCFNHEFWCHEQSTDYYRRHLALHEGTHGFMYTRLGAIGPPWFGEGMAELLGTHSWQDGQLRMAHFPASRDEVPMWGRIPLLKRDLNGGRRLGLAQVMRLTPEARHDNEAYAWTWAAAAFLDGHPRYAERFRKLTSMVAEVDFDTRFDELFAADRDQLDDEWQVFIESLDFGHDLERAAVVFAPGQPLPPAGKTVRLAADRGWQSSGVRLEAGRAYKLSATGRYAVARSPRAWWCEPNGVSIRYVNGRPTGMLIGAIRADGADASDTAGNRPARLGIGEVDPLANHRAATSDTAPPNSFDEYRDTRGGRDFGIGAGRTITPATSGTLYLKINDWHASLDDNSGTLDVVIDAVDVSKMAN